MLGFKDKESAPRNFHPILLRRLRHLVGPAQWPVAPAFGRLLFTCIALMIFLMGPTLADEAPRRTTFVVGIRAHLGEQHAIDRWQPTIDYLEQAIPGTQFKIEPLASPDEVTAAAQRNAFDFLITDPGSFVRVEVQYGVEDILSLVNTWDGKPLSLFGSVIFTRKERGDIGRLQDTRGQRLIAVSPDAFGGWLVALEEFLEAGVDPASHFETIAFSGGNQVDVIRAVMEGTADVGVVRTGTLERLARSGELDLSDIHVVAARVVPDFPFALSTDLYPEWVFASSPSVPLYWRERVAQALRAIPKDSNATISGSYWGWTSPASYWPVHKLLQELKVEPYANFGEISLREPIWHNRHLLAASGFVIFALIYMMFRTRRRDARLAKVNAELARLKSMEAELYRDALDRHAIVTVTDADGKIVHASERFLAKSGYSLEEVIGQSHAFLRSDFHDNAFYTQLQEKVRSGQIWEGEIANRRKDGSLWWVQTTIIPKFDPEGLLAGWISVRTDVTDLKAKQADLNLREFLNCVPNETYMFGEDYKIYFANSAARRVLNLSESEICGRTLMDFLPPRSAKHLRKKLARLSRDGNSALVFQKARILPNGNVVETEFHIQHVQPAGSESRFVATLTDVSGQVAAKGHVRELKATLDEISDQVYMFWPDSKRFFYVNRAVLEHHGLSKEELYEMTPSDLEGGLSAEECNTILAPMIAGERRHSVFRREITAKNGSPRIIEYEVKYLTPEGHRPRFVAILRDVTARVRAEEEVNLLKTSLDRIDSEVYMFWADTYEFAYMNGAALRRVSWCESGWKGKHTWNYISDRQQAALHEKCQAMIAENRKAMVFETTDRHGTPLEITLHLVAPKGERARFVSVYRDISERKQAEIAKGQFISTVSHELRTPLTSIKGSLGLLKAGLAKVEPDAVAKMIEIAHSNAERLHRLVDDILDWEKIEAGLMSYHMEEVDLSSLLQEAVETNQGYARQHGVTFELANTEGPAVCQADKGRLLQVMANLLSNAAKFSNEGQKVEVLLQLEDRQAVVSVRDHGIGIPKDAQATIFDRFTQVDSSDVRKVGGTGLGLSITKAIVEAHGGSIGLESKEGEGSTFFFRIPLVGCDGEATDLDESKTEEIRPYVLICENAPGPAMKLWFLLEMAGCSARVVTSASEARKVLSEERPDAIACNMHLTSLGGLEFVEELDRWQEKLDRPLIYYSASPEAEEEYDTVLGIVARGLSKFFFATDERLLHLPQNNIVPDIGAAISDPPVMSRTATAPISKHPNSADAKSVVQGDSYCERSENSISIEEVIVQTLDPEVIDRGVAQELERLIEKTGPHVLFVMRVRDHEPDREKRKEDSVSAVSHV